VSDSENAPSSDVPDTPNGLGDLLANFALGPAWARGEVKKRKSHEPEGGKKNRPVQREKHYKDDRQSGGAYQQRNDGRGQKRFSGRRDDGGKGRGFSQEESVAPAPGVRLSIVPDPEALHLIAKEVHHVARVYSLFDIATTLLADRHRCRAVFEVEKGEGPLFRGRLDDSVFLTRSEAAAHLWKTRALRDGFLDEETVEVDPPAGNYVAVARCGLSGEWLGPPNFHTYQMNLRRLHRERFPNMPFEAYQSRVRTERGEEAVNAWLESMKIRTRWRLKNASEDAPWIEDAGEAARALESAAFDEAFESTMRADVPASIRAADLSPGLLSTLKRGGGHIRKHPAMLIPAICKSLEAEHLPVFKRKGKLYTGPARPLALPADAVLAERPGRMVDWIRGNNPAKLEGLWQAVLPEGGSAPPAEYAADLFWMLQQGHVLLFTDDTLIVQEHHEPAVSAKKKPKKKKTAHTAPKKIEPEHAAKEEVVPEQPLGDKMATQEDGAALDADSGIPREQQQGLEDVANNEPPAASGDGDALESDPSEPHSGA